MHSYVGTRRRWVIWFLPWSLSPYSKPLHYPMHRSLVGPQSWSGRYGEEKNISACCKSNPDYSVYSLDNLLYWVILFLHTGILRYSTNVCSSHFVALYRGWQYIGEMKHCNFVGILELFNTLKNMLIEKLKQIIGTLNTTALHTQYLRIISSFSSWPCL
jgi:hypothetical protein